MDVVDIWTSENHLKNILSEKAHQLRWDNLYNLLVTFAPHCIPELWYDKTLTALNPRCHHGRHCNNES